MPNFHTRLAPRRKSLGSRHCWTPLADAAGAARSLAAGVRLAAATSSRCRHLVVALPPPRRADIISSRCRHLVAPSRCPAASSCCRHLVALPLPQSAATTSSRCHLLIALPLPQRTAASSSRCPSSKRCRLFVMLPPPQDAAESSLHLFLTLPPCSSSALRLLPPPYAASLFTYLRSPLPGRLFAAAAASRVSKRAKERLSGRCLWPASCIFDARSSAAPIIGRPG